MCGLLLAVCEASWIFHHIVIFWYIFQEYRCKTQTFPFQKYTGQPSHPHSFLVKALYFENSFLLFFLAWQSFWYHNRVLQCGSSSGRCKWLLERTLTLAATAFHPKDQVFTLRLNSCSMKIDLKIDTQTTSFLKDGTYT